MTAWVYVDTEGRVTGWKEYPESREKVIPEGAVEAPEGIPLKVIRDHRLVNGEWVYEPWVDSDIEPPEIIEQDKIQRAKKSAKEQVNQVSGQVRLKYISNIPGQDALYQEKKQEAQAYLSDPSPEASDYRLLQSDVVAGNAEDLYGAAQLILNMANLWRSIVGNLEDVRLMANNSIEDASNIDEVQQALDTFQQSLSEKGY